jgi:hypothetical protein
MLTTRSSGRGSPCGTSGWINGTSLPIDGGTSSSGRAITSLLPSISWCMPVVSRIIRGKKPEGLRSRAGLCCSRYRRYQCLKFRPAQPLAATIVDLIQDFSCELTSKYVAMIVLDAGVHHLPGLSPWVHRNIIPLGCLSQSDDILLSFTSQCGLARPPPMDHRHALHGALNTDESMRLCANTATLFSLEDVSLLMS